MPCFIRNLNVLRVNITQVVAFKMYFCLTQLHLIKFLPLTDFPHVLEVVIRSII